MHRVLASLVVIFLAASLPDSVRAVQADTPTPFPPTPASPRAFTADDRACGAFAEKQLAGDFGFSQEGIELLAGCRRTSSGEWFVPIGPDDPRLPNGSPLSREEETATTTLRQTLSSQRIAFGVILRQTSYYGPSFADTLDEMKPKLSPPFRALQNRNLYRSLQRHYEQIVISVIADPDNLALQEYVTWWISRRQAVAPPHWARSMPPVVYTANLDYYDFARAPWPWELRDPLTIDEYLAWALANGRVPAAPMVATSAPAPGGPSGADCTALARWMGETQQRRRQASTIINSIGQAAFPDEQVATGFEEDAGALALLATEQEESNPPTAAVALNAVLVQEYETYAEGTTLLAEAYRTGDRATSDAGWAARQKAQEYGAAATKIIEELERSCGIAPSTGARDLVGIWRREQIQHAHRIGSNVRSGSQRQSPPVNLGHHSSWNTVPMVTAPGAASAGSVESAFSCLVM